MRFLIYFLICFCLIFLFGRCNGLDDFMYRNKYRYIIRNKILYNAFSVAKYIAYIYSLNIVNNRTIHAPSELWRFVFLLYTVYYCNPRITNCVICNWLRCTYMYFLTYIMYHTYEFYHIYNNIQ